MSDPVNERLEAMVARAKKRVRWCHACDEHPAIVRCAAGGDCGAIRCGHHAVDHDNFCDHKWESIDDGAGADVAALLAVTSALPRCGSDDGGCGAFATWNVDGDLLACDAHVSRYAPMPGWLGPVELPYAAALRVLAGGDAP